MNLAEKAIDEIERRGWSQGGYRNPETGSVCALGALAQACGYELGTHLFDDEHGLPFSAYCEAGLALAATFGGSRVIDVAEWNDTPGRTEAEVLEALRLAGKELSK